MSLSRSLLVAIPPSVFVHYTTAFTDSLSINGTISYDTRDALDTHH